ncbi:TetR/AcrR family transcriptional regulator [Nakamurella sp.]|uniref:TetR/AcrR family transcriptional regulator n=1 Tax=Nakamurella sp. TaxID=1869182 RepID=UPI003B3AC94E
MATVPARPAAAAGPRGTRGRPARYSREELLGLIVAVFNERGYEAASMTDLAAATGLTKSAFYHHFTSKEEILGMAVDRALNALAAALDEATARPGRAVDRLEQAIRRTTEILIDQLPFVTILLRVRGNTVVERDTLARRRQIDARLAGLVEQAARAREIRDDVDPRLVSRLLFGMVNSVHEWYRPGTRTGSPQAIVDATVAIALNGLRPL